MSWDTLFKTTLFSIPDYVLDSAFRQMLRAERHCGIEVREISKRFFGRLVSQRLGCLRARCASTHRQSTTGCCVGDTIVVS